LRKFFFVCALIKLTRKIIVVIQTAYSGS